MSKSDKVAKVSVFECGERNGEKYPNLVKVKKGKCREK